MKRWHCFDFARNNASRPRSVCRLPHTVLQAAMLFRRRTVARSRCALHLLPVVRCALLCERDPKYGYRNHGPLQG